MKKLMFSALVFGLLLGLGGSADAASYQFSRLKISTSSLSHGRVGESYQETIMASGSGTWSIKKGDLPPGLELRSITCYQSFLPCDVDAVISGIPTKAGKYKFTVLFESGSKKVSRTYNIKITSPKKDKVTKGEVAYGTLSISPAEIILEVGQSATVEALYQPACPSGAMCIQGMSEVEALWSVANKKIATVSQNTIYCFTTPCPQGAVTITGETEGKTILSATYADENGKKLKTTAVVVVR